MRILWDSGNVGFGGCGINEWDRHVIEALRDKGHEVTLIVDDLLSKRPKFKNWNPPTSGFTRYDGKITLSNYREIYNKLGPFDVQIGNHFTMFPLCNKIVPVVHDVDIPGREEYSLSILLSLKGSGKLTNFFACTTGFIQEQVKDALPNSETSVIFSGSKFSNPCLPKSEEYTPQRPYVCYWGNRYEKSKNFLALLKSLKYHDFDLKVSGFNPPTKKELETVEKLGLKERVEFFTGLSDEELVGFIRNSDMYVCPSKYEGMGLPVIEAMSLGVPVVVSPCAALPSVVGDCGFLAESATAKHLGEAIKECSKNSSLRDDRVRKGLAKAEKWTWGNTADSLLKLVDSALRS